MQPSPQTFAQNWAGDMNSIGLQQLAGQTTGQTSGIPAWMTQQAGVPTSLPSGDQPITGGPDTPSTAPPTAQADTPDTGAQPDQPAAQPAQPAAQPKTGGGAQPRLPSPGQQDPYPGGVGTGAPQQGAGGQQQMPFNPQKIMQALMQGGPMGALSELAREAMGGQPGGTFPGRGVPYGPGTQNPPNAAPPSYPPTPQARPETAPQPPAAKPMPSGAGDMPTTAEGRPQGGTFIQNPNYNPADPTSQRYIPDPSVANNPAAAAAAPTPGGTARAPGAIQAQQTPINGAGYKDGRTAATQHAQNFNQPMSKSLANDRRRFAQELQQKPWLKEKALRIAYNEQGRNPQGTQAVLKSAMNRASVRGTSLEQALRWHRAEPGGYYQIGRGGMQANISPYREVLDRSLNNALGGSNVANYATDNSSGHLAASERATGKFNYRQGYTGETFFSPGSAEPGWARNWTTWAQRMMQGEGTATALQQ